MKNCFILYLSLLIFSFPACRKTETLYLSDLKQGFIANEFGPPERDLSFANNKISLNGNQYEKGLGVHSPSNIFIDLNGNGNTFSAIIGLDDEIARLRSDSLRRTLTKNSHEVYDGNKDLSDHQQGGTVNFRITGDGETIYSSGWMSEKSQPRSIDVDIRNIKTLGLVVEEGDDGSYADHADWADARMTVKNNPDSSSFEIYSATSDLLLNHSGFLPVSYKSFRTGTASENKEFNVVEMATGRTIYKGELFEKNGDWGKVFIGDFSSLTAQGDYYISLGSKNSNPFKIDDLQYINDLKKHLNWYLWQRCGDPEHGWERGQHRDDGVRLDNRKHQDVSGGWHDAADVRKWGMTINGLWALSEIYLSLSGTNTIGFAGQKEITQRIKDEFNWGNKYFSAMQEQEGYLMSQIGGDVYKHSDNNRFTDNISGTADDRWLVTRPNEPVYQYMYVISQCNISLAEKLNSSDPNFQRAVRCFRWATKNNINNDINALGASITASMKLYECTGDKSYLDLAKNQLDTLLSRQDTISQPVNGFFMKWENGKDNKKNNYYPDDELSYRLTTPDFPVWSVVEAIRIIKEPVMNRKVRKAFQSYFDGYIKYFYNLSSYGNVPMALYRKDPGGNRKAGSYYYRWCYVNNEDDEWWNGINPLIGYAGAYLVRGGLLTGNLEAVKIGQQQLDFIYGCNPFNASTATGIGYNQPDYFKTSTFVPHTPEIVGAVMAGIGSSGEDQPLLLPGWWQTTEYWMEAVTGTVMLLNELNNYQFEKK